MQGVGQEKELNGHNVFVKHDHCEESLKDINRYLANDSRFEPFVRLTLSDWKFLETHLIPIITLHKTDKMLAYLSCKLLVRLTEIPQVSELMENASETKKWSWTHSKSPYRQQMIESLRGYKLVLLRHAEALGALMEHLADCLQAEEKTQKHNEMIELLVVLFK